MQIRAKVGIKPQVGVRGFLHFRQLAMRKRLVILILLLSLIACDPSTCTAYEQAVAKLFLSITDRLGPLSRARGEGVGRGGQRRQRRPEGPWG